MLPDLMQSGFSVAFEGSESGDFFCLLRRIGTGELAHCAIGASPSGALSAAHGWACSNPSAVTPQADPETADAPERVRRLRALERAVEQLQQDASTEAEETEEALGALAGRVAELERLQKISADAVDLGHQRLRALEVEPQWAGHVSGLSQRLAELSNRVGAMAEGRPGHPYPGPSYTPNVSQTS